MGSDGRWVSTQQVVNHARLNVFDATTLGSNFEQAADALTGTEAVGSVQWDAIARLTTVCTLRPGQTLYIPALWHHAVASFAGPRSQTCSVEGGGEQQIEKVDTPLGQRTAPTQVDTSSRSAPYALSMALRKSSASALPVPTARLNVAVNLWFYSNASTASCERAARTGARWGHAEYFCGEVQRWRGRLDQAAVHYEKCIAGSTSDEAHHQLCVDALSMLKRK